MTSNRGNGGRVLGELPPLPNLHFSRVCAIRRTGDGGVKVTHCSKITSIWATLGALVLRPLRNLAPLQYKVPLNSRQADVSVQSPSCGPFQQLLLIGQTTNQALLALSLFVPCSYCFTHLPLSLHHMFSATLWGTSLMLPCDSSRACWGRRRMLRPDAMRSA